MKKLFLAGMLLASATAGARGATVDDIVAGLRAIGDYSAAVKLTVSPPMSPDDVSYTISLDQRPGISGDRLAPADYLIEWRYDNARQGSVAEGFSAYYDGHHYRFTGQRLQEYHMEWDSVPFTRSSVPVQRGAQFVSLLPAFMAEEIGRMAADSCYTLTVSDDTPGITRMRMVMRLGGVEALNGDYRFDSATMRPLRVDTENNPGAITEQPVSAVYSYPDAPHAGVISEEELAARHPDAFGRFRESNFRIENLPGTPLPAFALNSPEGVRTTHHRGEPTGQPWIVALLDPAAGFAGEMVSAVRRGADGLAAPAEVLWVMSSRSPGDAEDVVGTLRHGERLLLGGASLARDCGAASLPVLLLVDSRGVVGDVVLGYNKDLPEVVIQKMSMIQ